MRKSFAQELIKRARKDDRIWLLVGDLGYGVWDEFFKEFPDRAINCGASEMAMTDIAVGLALERKVPFVYSIPTFLIYRPFETLRTYVNRENIKVLMIGSGRDDDYHQDGFSHFAGDVTDFLDPLENIKQYFPLTTEEIPVIIEEMIVGDNPCFLSLRR